MIKFPTGWSLLLIVWTILFFLFMIDIRRCSNEPQFSCGYDPEKYHATKSLSIDSNSLKIIPIEFNSSLVTYGSNNNFCIADGLQKINNEYSINISLIKDDYAFYIHGGGSFSYTLIFESKNVSTLAKKDIKLFCEMISNHIYTDKIKYHDTSDKLCEY